MLNNPQQRKALVLSLLMVMLAQTAYIGAMQGWSYPTEFDKPSPQSRSAALENLFPDLDLRLFVDPSNSSSYSGSGTTLVDLSSYDHNGTIDGATWEAERTRFSFAGSCTAGAVANFDCDEINFGETNDHDPDSGGDWSVSAWFNASTIQQSVIVGKVDDGGASVDVGWMIRMNSNGVQVDVGTTGNSSVARTSTEAIATDRWYHVVLVADKGTSLAMFIDGVEVENTSLASSGDLRNTGNGVSIGSYNAGEYSQPFDGQIGAVMAYADALNLTAVNQLYNASKGVYSNSTALSYSPENMTLEKGTTMTPNTPSVSGGAITSWDIDPSLPSGLSFGSANGSIWGTPSVLQTSATTYTIWANNSGGSTSAQVNITINDQIASISYSSPVEISNNRPLSSTITPTNTGGAVTSWEITPTLPTGLTFGTSNGSIWGTPENVTSNATYTIWANNSGGSSSATLTLNINWTLTPSVDGASITRNSSIGTDITWEWDYDPLEAIYAGLVTGEWNTCAIDDNGDVFCWGRNGNGQIGNGQSGTAACGTSGHKCKDIPTRTTDLGSDVVALAFGHQHACGLTDAGVVKCWGRNNNGQIGTSGGDVDTPFTVSLGSGRTATSIYAGGHSTCAILDDGSTKCWGHNSDGQLGIGSTSNTNTPTTIGSLGSGRTAVSLAMAMTTVCALLDDGSVKCWGDDSQGQLGNGGTNADINSPPASAINLGSGRTAKSITAGEYHFCAILDDDSITCWGDGLNGKLGTGSTSDRSTPAAVSGSFASGRYAVYLDAGYDHTCAILDNGDLTCWGSDAKGQLGNGGGSSSDVSSLSSSVISLGSGRTAISVSAGGQHTCAQLDNGQLKCWGNRGDGQVGDNGGFNSPSDRTSPSTVSNNNYGGNTYADTGVFPSAAVTGATCAISPALPTGMSLTSGTCAITGTPSVTAFNTNYTVWANISGQSFSGQVLLEVGLNVPILSYSPTSYLFVNGTAIAEVQPINTGGEISGFEISPALPSGLSIGSTNGTIWGTPTVASALTSYTIWGNNSAGSSSTTISIKVETTPTSLSYDTENMTLTKGLAMTTNTATVGGGTPTSWEISPALPSGLSFSSTTGDISGTPTVLQTSAVTYTVWANNTAGSVNTSLNITINDVAPNSVVYSPENMSFTNNSAITTTTPTASGGAVTSWEISPALPSGLSFGSTNGSIWGTPTVEQSSTTYTVWANNSGGSSSGTINITIDPEPVPTLSYSPSNLNLNNNTVSSDLPLAPTLTGSGTITSWEINATLPAGLNFGTSNGTIWGVPTVLQTTATTYTIWANNSGGSSSFTITLTINDEAPGPFEYNPENNTLTNNTYVHLEPDFINITTGNGSSWSAPAGTFMPWASSCLHHVDNGTLYTAATNGTGASPTFYGYGLDNETAWVINSSIFAPGCYKFIGYGGMTSWHGAFSMAYGTSLYFEASEGNWDGLFGYGLENGTVWRESSNELEITSSFTAVVDDVLYFGAYHNSSVPSAMHAHNLSNGTTWLVLNASNGSPIQTYWTYAGGGRASVVGDVFFYYTYINSNFVYWAYNTSNGSAWAISSQVSSGGGPVLDGVFYYSSGSYYNLRQLYAYNVSNETSWQVHTRWGLNDIHEMDGVLYYGARSTTNSYTSLWAHNPDNGTTWEIGGTSQNNYFGFLDAGGTLFYRVHSGNSNERDLWAYEPSNTTAWQVTNVPLNGDTFTSLGNTVYFTSESTTISGEHDLWAYNTANETTWFVTNISTTNWGFTSSGSVHHPESTSLIFADNTLYIREGGGMRAHQPASINYQTNTGGNVTSWAINASLPSGLSFGTNNGTIYGTPTELWTQTSYMVWANNSGGSTVAYLNITVVDELPTLSYSPSTLVLTINNQSSDLPLNATLTGSGTITSWAISPALPSGLSFGTSNGTIWGTPTSLMTLKTFTIWANNSGGSSSATVNITVNDEAPDISYNPDWFVLTNNTAMSPTATPTNSGGAIPSGIIDSNGYVGAYTSIAIDSNGYKHVSYRDSSGLRYATDASGSWVTTPVDTSGSVGGYTSIAIDSDDAVHISYYDYSNKDLKYATCSSGCTTASNWDIVSIDTSGSVGTYTSIAIDSNDAVHISYHKGYNDYDLKYATCSSDCTSASNWDLVSVATTGLVGYHTSIAIDSNDAIHISYGDSSNGYLKYATCSSGCTSASNWNTVSIDTNTGGYDTSITIDSNDTVHISYRDGADADLEYATCSTGCTSASNWNLVSVDTTGYVGYASSIGVDSNNAVHISYYDSINDDLKYATCSSGCTSASNWNDRSLDTMGDVGFYTSIAIDSNDAIHISYFDGTNADLKYVTLDSSSNLHGYSISPDLPEGLELNVNTGEISGTPTELSTNTTYTITARNSGGVNTTTITIEVIDTVPTVSYSPENLTLTNNTVSSNLPLAPTITGSGAITSWALNNTSLPSGISFSTSTGTFSGTPTELWPTQAYMVWANNSGGSTVAYLNITVVDQLPTLISYSPNDLNLTNNTGFTPPTIIVLGSGTITSWELNNTSLPTGVLFGTNNGTIYGTPTELWNRTAYMVWANNSGGSTVAYLNITVVDEVPTLSYSPTNLNLTNNTVSSDLPLVPTVTGSGTITSWAINASLPSGLSFGTNNGTLYGTPTELWYQTAYMVWGNNSGGSSVAYLNITVVDQLPTVAYSPANVILTNNTASSDLPLVPIVTGQGEITLWGLNTSLPSGLSFDNNNGTIWGTPTELWPTTAYRLAALNSGGTTYAYFNLTVIDQLPTSVTYTPENLTLTRGELSSDLPLTPSLTGPGDITSWAINASLPTGLSFGTNNGTIWGVPQVNMTTTAYTVWANNTGGSVSTTINLTVLEPVVVLDYNPENLTLIRGVQMTDLVPSVSGGNVSNWSITPALPAGLNFSDGVVSGTPTVNLTLTMYTVWATTSGGTTSHTLNITVLEPSGNLSYSPENITLTRGVAMSDLHPTYSGGTVENWSIHPALPDGLNFSNGIISGTPTVNMTTSMFTIYANNSGGSAAATINLTILEPVVDLFYSPDNLTLMRGTTMMPLLPTVSGGNVSEWALVGVLPEGLNFSNGVFSGTPLVNMTPTPYLVYANTSGGSATAWVNITVLEPAVDLSYNPYNITLTRNVTMNPLSPTVSGGNVSNWSIFPELPAGLNFTNGTISGTPEVNMTTTMFTVWANTSGGAASTTVNITIVEPPVDFLYSPNAIVLTRNETMNATSPVFGGDAMAEEWGISPALPEGLNFTNGTISGTPLVNMTATVFTIYANNTGGTAVAYLTITILEPLATVVYVPENITLTRGEDNASLVPILGGGMVASWSISPDLPEGMVFDNGSITGVPLVNMTNTTFTVMALNSGGMAFAFLNLTVVEPVAVLAFNESFVVTRGEDLLNATVNNTGGTVATWAIEPALPAGVSIFNGWLYGVSQANLTETVFTLWANNSGGSVNLTFTLEVLEPVANISYPVDEIELISGISRSLLIPTVEGGVPETWAIEPALPNGLALVNGYVVGLPTAVIETTTFTVWANNSGGSSVATFTLTVAYPEYYARYPVTRVVVDVNETMPTLNPIYYFGSNEDPLWSISPTLPDGLVFDNGTLSGTPTMASNETNYTITVTGDMAPVAFYIIIEVREKVNLTVPSVRNETEEPVFSLPEPTPPDDGFDMYFICFPLLLLLLLLGVAAINNFLALAAKDDEDDDEPENEAKGDDEGQG